MLWAYLRRGPSRFRSAPWYGPALQGRRLPLEPAVKLFGPALIAYIEMYGDHAQFRCAGHCFLHPGCSNWLLEVHSDEAAR